ncbi:MAG: DUF1569 domain-containing protein [Planctomycetota bacterium]
MKSKTLPRFQSFDEALQYIESLHASGYQPTGRWSLGQICNHLSESIDLMSGRLSHLLPRFVQRLFFGSFLRLTFLGKVGRLFGLRMPTVLPQKEPVDDGEGIQRLKDAVQRLESSAPHSVSFHLWHCRHHLSFLVMSPQQNVAVENGRRTQASLA